MLDNRGQVLIFFVLLIPIFLLVLVLVVDIGNISYQKESLANICNLTLDYMKEDTDINRVKEYVMLNDNKVKDVVVKDNKLFLYKKVDGLLSHVINIDVFDIKVNCEIERVDLNE